MQPAKGRLVADKTAAVEHLRGRVDVLKNESRKLEKALRDADATRKQHTDEELRTKKALKQAEVRSRSTLTFSLSLILILTLTQIRHEQLREHVQVNPHPIPHPTPHLESLTQTRHDQLRENLHQLESESSTDAVQLHLEEIRFEYTKARDDALACARDLEAAKDKVAEANEKCAPLLESFEEAKKVYTQLCDKQQDYDDQITAARAPLTKARSSLQRMRKALSEAEKAKQEATKKMADCEEYIKKNLPVVEGIFGPRVHDPQKRTVEQLKKEKLKLEKELIRAQSRHGNKTLDQVRLCPKLLNAHPPTHSLTHWLAGRPADRPTDPTDRPTDRPADRTD